MKIAVLGATGRAGSRIIDEALARGHSVTGVARDASKVDVEPNANLSIAIADSNSAELPDVLRGHDVVVSSMRFSNVTAKDLLQVVRTAGVKRFIIVGGSGSLEVSPGLKLVDTPALPEMYRPEALAGRQFLNDIREESELDWTFISPTATLDPGERTGHYRIGGDQLMVDADGNSFISMEDSPHATKLSPRVSFVRSAKLH